MTTELKTWVFQKSNDDRYKEFPHMQRHESIYVFLIEHTGRKGAKIYVGGNEIWDCLFYANTGNWCSCCNGGVRPTIPEKEFKTRICDANGYEQIWHIIKDESLEENQVRIERQEQ